MDWLVTLVVGGSVVVLALIIWPISRRIRAETGMDRDLEAALLLGEPIPDETPEPVAAPFRDFDPGEIRALQEIGKPEAKPKRRRKKH